MKNNKIKVLIVLIGVIFNQSCSRDNYFSAELESEVQKYSNAEKVTIQQMNNSNVQIELFGLEYNENNGSIAVANTVAYIVFKEFYQNNPSAPFKTTFSVSFVDSGKHRVYKLSELSHFIKIDKLFEQILNAIYKGESINEYCFVDECISSPEVHINSSYRGARDLNYIFFDQKVNLCGVNRDALVLFYTFKEIDKIVMIQYLPDERKIFYVGDYISDL